MPLAGSVRPGRDGELSPLRSERLEALAGDEASTCELKCAAWTAGDDVVRYPMSDGCVEMVAGLTGAELGAGRPLQKSVR